MSALRLGMVCRDEDSATMSAVKSNALCGAENGGTVVSYHNVSIGRNAGGDVGSTQNHRFPFLVFRTFPCPLDNCIIV